MQKCKHAHKKLNMYRNMQNAVIDEYGRSKNE